MYRAFGIRWRNRTITRNIYIYLERELRSHVEHTLIARNLRKLIEKQAAPNRHIEFESHRRPQA